MAPQDSPVTVDHKDNRTFTSIATGGANGEGNGEANSDTLGSVEVKSRVSVSSQNSSNFSGCIPKDEGWSWVVLVASFFLQTIAVGVCLSSGLFLVEFMETFEAQTAETAWISSLELGVAYLIGAPVSGAISYWYSHRTSIILGGLLVSAGLFSSAFATGIVYLYLTCGLIAGFGVGLIYSPGIGIIGRYFERRLPLALGCVMAGGGAGAMVFSILFRYLIETYQWRGALIVTSGIVLNCCVIGAMLFPPSYWNKAQLLDESRRCWILPTDPSRVVLAAKSSGLLDSSSDVRWTDNPNRRISDNCSLFIDPHFLLFLLNSFFMCFGTMTVFILLVDYAESCSIPRDSTALLLSILGLFSAGGRFAMAGLMGALSSCKLNTLHLYLLSTLLAAGSVVLLPASSETFLSFAVLCAIFGFTYGGICSSSPVVVSESFGAERLTTVYAYTLVASGVGCLLGPPFSGWMYQVTESYRLPFLLNGAAIALSFLVLLPISCHSCYKAHRGRFCSSKSQVFTDARSQSLLNNNSGKQDCNV